jgi:hypothetical protein
MIIWLRFGIVALSSLFMQSLLVAHSSELVDFELPDYALGVQATVEGFSFDATDLSVVVTDLDAATGQQSLQFTGDGTFTFTPDDGYVWSNVVWVDYYLKPGFVVEADLPLSFSAERTTATGFVQMASDGELYVVDGDGFGGGQWLASGSEHMLDGEVAQDWIRLTCRLDYSVKRWDLYVDGAIVAFDLNFLNPSASEFEGFTFDSGLQPTGLDAFSATTWNPLFTDTANDGLPDTWLQQFGFDLTVNQRYLDPDSDGLTNLLEYVLDSDASNPDSDGDGLADGAEYQLGSSLDLVDSDWDGLDDWWESQNGLDLLADDAGLDSDGDGMVNLDEYLFGLDPQLPDVIGALGLARRDIWMDVTGDVVSQLTKKATFPRSPTYTRWMTELDLPKSSSMGSLYGQRIHGLIVAPESADYTFWVAGDDAVEFWLSSDASSFNRVPLACVETGVKYREWGASSLQQSQAIRLEQGQEYYFEILHKQRGASDHVSLAWQYGSNSREIVPGAQLKMFAPEEGDSDADGLPDAWELANGLNPDASHLVNGYAGDFDGDGIANYRERLLGTRADLADTDGDGFNDFEEVERLHSNPLLAEFDGEPVLVAQLDGSLAARTSGSWSTEGDEIYSNDTTGSIGFDLEVPESGSFRLLVRLTEQNSSKSGKSEFELRASIGGVNAGIESASVFFGDYAELTYDIPYLDAGTHSLDLDWLNGFSDSLLRIASVRLEQIGGVDLDQDGVADWLEDRAQASGGEAELPVEIYTSPFCFEGTSYVPSRVAIRSYPASDNTDVRDEAVEQALANSYYADVELLPDEDRVVCVDDQNGLRSSQHTLTWAAFNAVMHESHHIRLGDSMLLTAIDDSLPQARPVELQLTAPDSTVETHTLAAEGRLQVLFDQTGDWLLQATLLPLADEEPVIYDSLIRVSEASLIPAPIIFENTARLWKPTISDPHVVLEADAGMSVYEETPGKMPRKFELNSQIDGGRLLARLPDGGAILSVAEASVIRDYSQTHSYNSVVESFPDGTLMVSAYILLSEVPDDLNVKLKIMKSGVVFDDGTVTRTITADDFDELGRYRFYLLRAPGVDGGNCYRYWFKQDGLTIGSW